MAKKQDDKGTNTQELNPPLLDELEAGPWPSFVKEIKSGNSI